MKVFDNITKVVLLKQTEIVDSNKDVTDSTSLKIGQKIRIIFVNDDFEKYPDTIETVSRIEIVDD